jgi:hypothetical protein
MSDSTPATECTIPQPGLSAEHVRRADESLSLVSLKNHAAKCRLATRCARWRTGHTDFVSGVAATADARRSVAASQDHTLKVGRPGSQNP